MSNPTYDLTQQLTVLDHAEPGLAAGLPAWLRDGADGRAFNETDALAASGDYFMVLVTRLDLLSQSLPRDSAEQIELEHLIDTLFYLHKHYAIVPKSKLR